MNGKTLKVVEYNLTFGSNTRTVNVFSFFKYKNNGNLYVIYTDTNTKYELLYYGIGHQKNTSLLTMSCKIEEQEIIKEFIYKLTNNESLENFEIYNLENITDIEIVSSNKLEVKLEIIKKLEELTIPKKEEEPSDIKVNKKEKTTKKKILPKIIILIFFIIIMGGGSFYLKTIINNNEITKIIQCSKNYQHEDVNALIIENNTYKFMQNNNLKSVEKIKKLTFNSQNDYENFINSGKIHDYISKENSEYIPNNEEYSIEFKNKLSINSDYTEPTDYETAISYYTNNGYNCIEKIEDK